MMEIFAGLAFLMASSPSERRRLYRANFVVASVLAYFFFSDSENFALFGQHLLLALSPAFYATLAFVGGFIQ
jgi:hypothetical protein